MGRTAQCQKAIGKLCDVRMTATTGLVAPIGMHQSQSMETPVLVIAPPGQRSHALCVALRQLGFVVDVATDAEHGVAQARDSGISLILIDAADPEGRGVGAIRTLRDEGNPAAILALTAIGDTAGIIECIEAGADGCADDTASGAELAARLRAIIRRCASGWGAGPVQWIVDDLHIDPSTRTVIRNAASIRLSPRELAVLVALLRRQGRAVSHKEVFREVWHEPPHRSAQRVASVILSLRHKLEHDQANPQYIRTVRGGYLVAARRPRSQSSNTSV